MKRPLDTDEDSESESESEVELDHGDGGGGGGGGSVISENETSGRSSKTKERNRMHSKLTRLRRVSRINQMKQRLLDLQTEVRKLKHYPIFGPEDIIFVLYRLKVWNSYLTSLTLPIYYCA